VALSAPPALSFQGLVSVEAGRADCPVVCLRGEHDTSSVAVVSDAVASAIALGGVDLVVDLSDVQFMDAATVGLIIRIHKLLQERSGFLVLRSPSARARRVLDLCDLDLPVLAAVGSEL